MSNIKAHNAADNTLIVSLVDDIIKLVPSAEAWTWKGHADKLAAARSAQDVDSLAKIKNELVNAINRARLWWVWAFAPVILYLVAHVLDSSEESAQWLAVFGALVVWPAFAQYFYD